MQIQLSAPKIWLATEPVDFRKSINGLSELVAQHFMRSLEDHIYLFFNKRKDKLKLLTYHRNGAMLIYKQLDKNKFTLMQNESELLELDDRQLSWLLAGLDWVSMSTFNQCSYDDYF